MKIKTLFSAAVLHTAFLFPTSYSWVTANLTGNWSTPADWTPAGPPTLAGDIATFPTGAAGPVTVTVDMATFIVGALSFTNTANAYTIAASSTNSLNLQGSAGTATITNDVAVTSNNVISAPLVLTNPLTITQNSAPAFPLTISGIMSGAGSVTTAGTGTTVITGVNTYTGGTNVPVGQLNCNATGTLPAAGALTITGGTVQCGAVNVLPATGTVTINSGTLNLNGSAQTMGALAGTGGTVTLGAVTLTSTTSTTTTYSGAINSVTGGGFTLAGSGGMLTLTNNTGYNGTTTVNGSTLVLGPGVSLSPGANLTVNGPGVINLGNTAQTVGVLSGTGNGSIILPALTPGLTNNGTALSTFAGSISGSGGFTQAGTFILTLTGQNTYTGQTTINAGATLQLGGINDIPNSSPVAISGTLDMTPAGSTQQIINSPIGNGVINLGATQLTINTPMFALFSGTMNGSGSVTLAGPFPLQLNGNSTYTGGTTVNGGILRLGIPGALPTAGNLAVNSPGTFDLNSNAQTIGLLSGNGNITTGAATGILTVNTPAGMSSTFSGVMSQAGQLIVGSTGTLILTGPNTYSGGTLVNAGANLQGNSTSLQGAITNNGNLIFNQPSPGTFTGAIGGGGTLILSAGTLTVPGFTQGNALVNAGQLILGSNSVTVSPISVAPGATLSLVNTAMVTGNISVGGTFNIGLGTLHVLGSYAQSPGSTFDVELSSGSSGFLPVVGTVTLTGSPAIDISFLPGTFAPSQVYTLITSTAPVAGTFAAPVFENPFFEGHLIYNAVGTGSVQLVLEIAPFSNVIIGGNAGAIAKCINPLAFPAESNILPLIDTLIFLPVKEVRKILDEIQPSQLKALGLTEENNLVVIRSSLSQHMDNLYKTECNRAMSELYGCNIWGNFSGDFLRQEGQRENIGYSADTAAVTIGIDGALGQNAFLGVAGAYDYTWLDWSNSRGHGSISSFYAGPYFTWFNRRVFINTSILGTFNNYKASRHIRFPTFDMHARNSHTGHGLIAHFDLGVMMYPTAGMTVSPLAGVDYIHLWEKGYTERGAAGLDMTIFPTHASLYRTELGIEIAKIAVLTHNKWTHDLKLSWIHQFPMSGKNLHAKFADVNCTFTVRGLEPNEDYFDVATGLTGLFMKDKLSAALRYEGKFGDGIRDNTGYIQLTYRY